MTEKDVKSRKIVRLNVNGFDIKIRKQLIHHKDKWVSKAMQIVVDELSKVNLSS